MTDFTVDEYKGFSEEELGQILQAEIIHMFHSNSSENDFGGAYSYLRFPEKVFTIKKIRVQPVYTSRVSQLSLFEC